MSIPAPQAIVGTSARASRRCSGRGVALLLIAAMSVAPCLGANDPTPPEPQSPPGSIGTYPTDNSPMPPLPPAVPELIFFPPVPPPLDAPVARAPSSTRSGPTPPSELATFVGETFYAPLGNQLAEDELSKRLRRRLDAYRATRDDLRTEIEVELARVRLADAATRERTLSALAVQQAPRLAELEKTAEELRVDLVDGHFDWFALRQWHLGSSRTRGDFPDEVAAVMRAYAFYRSGLLPVQRSLLREIAMELAFAKGDTEAATAAQPYFFFSPEMSRVQLAEDLPASLAARIAEYQTKKSAVKKELYDAIYEQEKTFFFRTNVLKATAVNQTAPLAELEKLAEEIRRGLAALPNPVRAIGSSPLPPVLTERVTAVVRQRAVLLRDAQAKIDEINRQLQTTHKLVALDYAFDAAGLKFDVTPRLRQFRGRDVPNQEVQRQLGEVRLAMTTIATDYGARFAELANEVLAIHDAIASTLVAAGDPAPDVAFAAAMRYANVQESVTAYRDYRTAVFEPGLSPEQRRLLFGSALAQLKLPLPIGELQPMSRPK